MKYLFIIILLFSLTGCSIFKSNRINLKDLKPKLPTKEEFDTIALETFQLKRMDTITYEHNNVFYMEKGDLTYKVVSKKENIDSCEKMVVGNFYDLKIPINRPGPYNTFGHVDGTLMYGNETVTYDRLPYMKIDIYITPYIRGICYIKD